MWRWYAAQDDAAPPRWLDRLAAAWLRRRLRFAVRMRAARYSLRSALSRALQIGLPLAAVIAATVPVWGMSWYFDTENWAAGIWNSWAEARTDTWREAMVRAVLADEHARRATPLPFAVRAGGCRRRRRLLVHRHRRHRRRRRVAAHPARSAADGRQPAPDVRFVVISSDVVYPAGAMKDYEAKFWLPFKGMTKPVYAIPGNHDWYDALEGFAATFLEPDAARAAMRARVEADMRLTSTTDARIERLIARGGRGCAQQYGVPTGFQRAPFFEIQTDRFALIAVDTGVVRRVDAEQLAWLRAALERARGKMMMAILGHPFYAGGARPTPGRREFAALKRLLREHGVAIVMAGDTHDLEYYAEPAAAHGAGRCITSSTAAAAPT